MIQSTVSSQSPGNPVRMQPDDKLLGTIVHIVQCTHNIYSTFPNPERKDIRVQQGNTDICGQEVVDSMAFQTEYSATQHTSPGVPKLHTSLVANICTHVL